MPETLERPVSRLPAYSARPTVRIDGQPWGKVKPAPALPAEVIEHTAAKYREALERLMG